MSEAQRGNAPLSSVPRAAIAALTLLAAAPALVMQAAAHTYQVIHDFTGGADGGVPGYTLAFERGGQFVGTANSGGQNNAGVVFSLALKNSKWRVTPLYDFTGQDGQPGWGVALFKGSIYTNASYASVFGGPCGSALQLNRSQSFWSAGSWQSVLMRTYVKKEDGCPTGNLVLDRAGNVFGVTQSGGPNGWGSVFELTPSGSSWKETILYSFQGANDGGAPYSGPIFDGKGNLYGTTSAKGVAGYGTVFELKRSKSGWKYELLYSFQGGNDGGQPVAGLIFDGAGNLYGATTSWGVNGGGTLFELSPTRGSWSFNVLASLTGTDGPVASLTMDSAGKIYGTNFMDGKYGYGSVFKLSPSGRGWTYRDLHDFSGGSDGGYPGGGVVFDAGGNLFGTAVLGGANSLGVIYEITP